MAMLPELTQQGLERRGRSSSTVSYAFWNSPGWQALCRSERHADRRKCRRVREAWT